MNSDQNPPVDSQLVELSTEPTPGTQQRNNSDEVISLISFAEKEEQEREHWQLLKKQLLENQLEFSTGPLQAHVQFSNYCNLSCIMCWNGRNPRTKKISGELLERIEKQLGPQLSLMIPFSGSEPLILTWDETRGMAERYGVLLRITSNLQFLDEAKFNELKGITETLCVSVDCHIPEVLTKIRQRARTDDVLENLERTVRLCRENDIECIVNVVLLTYNAPFLPDTIRYFHSIGVENVDVLQMVDINHESYFFDPLIHYSGEYIDWIQKQAVEACRESKMRLMWNVGRNQIFDFREKPVLPHPRKTLNDHNQWLLKHYVPGFCRHACNGLRLELDGDVAPCFLATEGELSLGNLADQDFEDIWNGVNARDLRRGMYTGDVPSLCQSCRLRAPLPPRKKLPFVEHIVEQLQPRFLRNGVSEDREVRIVAPEHNERLDEPPTILLEVEARQTRFLLAIALGGSIEQIQTQVVKGKPIGDNRVRIELPQKIWDCLRPNLGYWWTVWQFNGRSAPVIAANEIRCLIRHRPMERLPGSTLGYLDEGHKPCADLGADKKIGFEQESK